jgi:hypothetical protein
MSAPSPTMPPTAPAVNSEALQALHGKVLGDCNAGIGGLLAFLGDKLGLFRLLAKAGPLTTTEVAEGAGVNERLVREWLSAVAAAGYVMYEPDGERFSVTPEQAVVFAAEGHPAFLQGAIDLIYSLYHDEPKLRDAFRHGRGVPWGDHNACLFCSTERFFGPLYRSSILSEWLPAIDGDRHPPRRRGRRRRRVREGDIGADHGRGVPGVAVHRVRQPRRQYRLGSPGCYRCRADRPRAIRACVGEGVRRRVRLSMFLRLSARHG